MDYILEADIYEGCNQLNMLEYSLECIGIDENEFGNEGATHPCRILKARKHSR